MFDVSERRDFETCLVSELADAVSLPVRNISIEQVNFAFTYPLEGKILIFMIVWKCCCSHGIDSEVRNRQSQAICTTAAQRRHDTETSSR